MSDLIRRIAPLHVDHVAVTTAHFEDAVRDYLAAPGARIVRGPGYNDAQHVRYAFVRLDIGLVVEVLGLPEDSGGPIAGHVARGGGAYHLCYAVADIDASLAAAEAAGARIVSRPKPDPAHDGRPVAFLLDKTHGLIELVAAWPADFAVSDDARPARAEMRGEDARASSFDDGPLLAVFRSILKTLSDADIRSAELGCTPGWDSLAQLQLVMEVERQLDVRIPMKTIENLNSYREFAVFIGGRN